MNTPITDAIETKRMDADIPVVFGTVPSHVARRLELDRSALMEALDRITRVSSVELAGRRNDVLEQAKSALDSARANFPTP